MAAICLANKKGEVSKSQRIYFSAIIGKYPAWSFVGCYTDKKTDSTSGEIRGDIQQLLTDCYAGKIDIIFTKGRCVIKGNIKNSINFIKTFNAMDPPIGLYMYDINFYTLRPNADLMLFLCSEM